MKYYVQMEIKKHLKLLERVFRNKSNYLKILLYLTQLKYLIKPKYLL